MRIGEEAPLESLLGSEGLGRLGRDGRRRRRRRAAGRGHARPGPPGAGACDVSAPRPAPGRAAAGTGARYRVPAAAPPHPSKPQGAMPAHDVLIIGAGLAGQRAALAAAEQGASVAIMSKVHPVRSHSVAAAGGINAAISVDDDWRSHAYDTVKGSDFLGDQDAIEVMCSEAPAEVMHLEHIGVTFHRNEKGEMDLRAFGGASMKRTAYVADITGQAMLHVLYEQLMKHHETVERYEEWFTTSLLHRRERATAAGVIARDVRSGRMEAFTAKNVILACGGAGQAYKPTTNGLIVTGDGIAMAYRAGAPLMDMEMVQYHPTCLVETGILITEGARGEGAHLLNAERRALHGEIGAEQDGARLARRRLARRADRDQRGPRRRPERRGHLPRRDRRAAQAHARGAARDRQPRPRLRRRRHHARTDHDPPRPALHHGRRQDRRRRAHADRGPLRGRRGGLRVGPRRQPPRRQLAARHADLRPPRRRTRRRARRARWRCRSVDAHGRSCARDAERDRRDHRPPARGPAGLGDQGRARRDDEPPRRRVPRRGRACRARWRRSRRLQGGGRAAPGSTTAARSSTRTCSARSSSAT